MVSADVVQRLDLNAYMPRITGMAAEGATEDSVDGAMPIGAVAAALGVSVDTLRRWDREGRLTFSRRGNRRVLAPEEFTRFVRDDGATPRSSVRNRLKGVIVEVKHTGATAQIDIACGPYRIVSLMSREAADALGLEPGAAVVATLKSANVVLESL